MNTNAHDKQLLASAKQVIEDLLRRFEEPSCLEQSIAVSNAKLFLAQLRREESNQNQNQTTSCPS